MPATKTSFEKRETTLAEIQQKVEDIVTLLNGDPEPLKDEEYFEGLKDLFEDIRKSNKTLGFTSGFQIPREWSNTIESWVKEVEGGAMVDQAPACVEFKKRCRDAGLPLWSGLPGEDQTPRELEKEMQKAVAKFKADTVAFLEAGDSTQLRKSGVIIAQTMYLNNQDPSPAFNAVALAKKAGELKKEGKVDEAQAKLEEFKAVLVQQEAIGADSLQLPKWGNAAPQPAPSQAPSNQTPPRQTPPSQAPKPAGVRTSGAPTYVRTRIIVPVPAERGSVVHIRPFGRGLSRVVINRGTDSQPFLDYISGSELPKDVLKAAEASDIVKKTSAKPRLVAGQTPIVTDVVALPVGTKGKMLKLYAVEEDGQMLFTSESHMLSACRKPILKKIWEDAQEDRVGREAFFGYHKANYTHPDTGLPLTDEDKKKTPWLFPDAQIPHQVQRESNFAHVFGQRQWTVPPPEEPKIKVEPGLENSAEGNVENVDDDDNMSEDEEL